MFKNLYHSLSVPALKFATLFAVLLLVGLQVEAAPTEYKLGPGDVLSVVVDKHPEFSADQVTVTPAGIITLPVVAPMKVTGKTLQQLDAEITNGLKKRLLRPRVTVILVKARPQQIFVLGPVAKQGAYEMQPGWRISEALTSAGGLTVRPALTEAVLTRPNGKTTTIDLGLILNDSNNRANLQLQPGDRLLITERTIKVTVAGQVKSGGQVTLPIGSSASDALAFAEGALPDAALTQAEIRRAKGLIQPVNLFKVLIQGDKSEDIELREGDVLTVPRSSAKITVTGRVARPGDIPIQDGRALRVAEAVAQAGNYSDDAALTRASVQRGDEIIPVNLYDVLIQRDPTDNIVLQSGDILDIPESKATVTILGAVNKPGIYEIPDGQSLSVAEAVAQAGSYNDKAALTRATLRRDNGEIEPVDLYQIIRRGQQQHDKRLQPGDIVVVPEAKGITVLGSVNRPGTFNLEEGTNPRLATALATAGGLEAGLPAKDIRITITRTLNNGNQTILTPDAVSLINRSNPQANADLQDGDLITVSEIAKRTITISGEVERPGAYELKEGESLPQLLARAGGVKESAALQQVSVTQDGETKIVDALSAVRRGANLDFPLSAGANVIVPENQAKVLVFQAVNRPGAYPIPEGETLTLGEAIGAAGGTQPNAKKVIIARQLPNGEVEKREVSFDPNKTKDSLASNIPLQSGDVVYVPDGKAPRPFVSTLLSFFAPLSFLFR